MEVVSSVPVAMMIMMMASSQEALCASLHVYASECTRMHLRKPKKFPGRASLQTPDPPTMNDCRTAMFSTSANDIAPKQKRAC